MYKGVFKGRQTGAHIHSLLEVALLWGFLFFVSVLLDDWMSILAVRKIINNRVMMLRNS